MTKSKGKKVKKTKKGAKMRKPSVTLTEKEGRVLEAFIELGATPDSKDEKGNLIFVSLSDLAGVAFAKRGTSPKTKGNSWVRNSMRKLLKMKLVKHKGGKSGLYARTEVPVPEVVVDVDDEGTEGKKPAKEKAKAKPKAKAKAKAKEKAEEKKAEAEAAA